MYIALASALVPPTPHAAPLIPPTLPINYPEIYYDAATPSIRIPRPQHERVALPTLFAPTTSSRPIPRPQHERAALPTLFALATFSRPCISFGFIYHTPPLICDLSNISCRFARGRYRYTLGAGAPTSFPAPTLRARRLPPSQSALIPMPLPTPLVTPFDTYTANHPVHLQTRKRKGDFEF
ncbi:hypothetical protein FIBSPDRAFT_960609 [Athelia psychrophila]|uniref:Uncharacterized protein n=1 Tax=Athelia psychrophila TaxID=1759441 RepID=A0A166C5U0_9AGAM|nr:hypothetical protein FIBSPDRAFT_960609 [Fibularhizoctonia sp. CBS 109695]